VPAVALRAYASLNDFLAPRLRQRTSYHATEPRATVKDFIERVGIPHVEVDLLIVNGESTGFDRLLDDGDRVAAFPRFFAIDVADLSCVRPAPRRVAFVLDVHLGRLARYLRLAGLDVRYTNDASDEELAAVSAADGRILLTRDVGLLKRRAVALGYFVRSTMPKTQFVEVLRRFDPLPLDPFTRCLTCGGELWPVDKQDVLATLPPRTRDSYERFWRCSACRRVFWKGPHYDRLARLLERTRAKSGIRN
jgi:uncharacterized protein with PIN domain